MPELPEVETIKTILQPIVKGKSIKDIRCFRKKSIVSDPDVFLASLIGETFLDVTRKGKFLVFHLTHDKVVISHLRMEGKYFEGRSSDVPDKHDVLIYDFTDGSSLRFNDVRKFGILMLSNEKDYLLNPPLSLLGPEPWDLDVNTFHKGLQRRKSEPIKEALLDQTLISGLGNIYDDEVLFATKINPKMEANLISLKQAEAIKKESIRILREAIKNGGSTIRSYHPKEGVSGMMQNELLAYGKGNTPCSRCGFPLRKISIGGRGTVYCPICQHIEGKPLIVGVTGPIASGKSSVSTYLESNGYQKIDADATVSSLYMENDVKNGLSSLFGEEAVKDGNVDRDYLSKMLLDGANKEKLDSFIHPLVYKRIEEEINNSKAKRIVIDVPLLIDSPLEEICDLIIYVEANEKTQIARLVERGKDPKTSLAINSGFPRGKAKKKAGIVIDANYDINHLKKELESYDFLLDK